VKLHLLLDHQGLLPSFALITEGRVHESRVARSLRFEPGTIVVFDRGYADYDWFATLDAEGVFFVTRLKENADYGGWWSAARFPPGVWCGATRSFSSIRRPAAAI
jgi:Transposase DDE domain